MAEKDRTSGTTTNDCYVELGIGEEEFIIEGERSGQDSFEDGLHGMKLDSEFLNFFIFIWWKILNFKPKKWNKTI